MEVKYCVDPNCLHIEPQSLDSFYSQKKSKKDGTVYIYYNPECKECTKKRAMKWQKGNPKEYKKIIKRRDSKEKVVTARKIRNKERHENGYFLEYQRNNKDKLKTYREERMHKIHKISNKEWESCKEYFNYECAYCGLSLSEHYIKFRGEIRLGDFHREHVDHNGANDLSNCVPSCKGCNSKKNRNSLEEWYTESNLIFNASRISKITDWLEGDYEIYIQ